MNNGKPTGPVDVAAFIAEIRAGKVKPRTRTIQVYLNPGAADEANEILERLDKLAAEEPKQVGIAEAEPVSTERAALEARYDELAGVFRGSLTSFTFRAEKVGDTDAIEAALRDDDVDPDDTERKLAYRIAHHCVDPVLSGQDVVDLMPVLGTQQVLQMNAACEATLRVPAPLSRKPFAGRVTGKS